MRRRRGPKRGPDGLMTYDEIGARLGVSRQRAQQICERALEKLRGLDVVEALRPRTPHPWESGGPVWANPLQISGGYSDDDVAESPEQPRRDSRSRKAR